MAKAVTRKTRRALTESVSAHARATWFKARDKRPLNLAHGRWIGDFGELSEAERKLVYDCGRGAYCGFGEGCPQIGDFPDATAHSTAMVEAVTRPPQGNPGNTIRAELLRFLILGGDDDHPLHEGGIQIVGAWITGELDLSVSTGAGYLGFYKCHFDSRVNLDYARLPLIVFSGSWMPRLTAICVKIDGDAYLDMGFEVAGGANLIGAQISGSLLCAGGHFCCIDEQGRVAGIALTAGLAQITGNLQMCDGFVARGEVQLHGAHVGGLLSIVAATFVGWEGPEQDYAMAINAEGLHLKGGLLLRKSTISGCVNLLDVVTSSLSDDLDCWPCDSLILDGFRYDRISFGSTEAVERIEWLRKQRTDELGMSFRPQPWEHLIKVLREMGHPNQAKLVAIEKQRALRQAGKVGARPLKPVLDRSRGIAYNLDQLANWIAYPADLAGSWIRSIAHFVYGAFGYGHRPFRIVGLILLVLLFCGFLYSDLGIDSPDCFDAKSGTAVSSACPHDVFLPWRYSADMILPLDFGLFEKGHPDPASVGVPAEAMGTVVALSWFETLFGWLFSGLLVAIAGRIVQRD